MKDIKSIGRGWTQRLRGRPHAETEALKRAGKEAKGATLYVTLEPCSHQGKTPPASIFHHPRGRRPRAVSGLEDPNPKVVGGATCQASRSAASRSRRAWAPRRRRTSTVPGMSCRANALEVVPAGAAEARGIIGRQGGASRPEARGHHRRGRARARPPDAGGGRRHPGRHRHGAVRRSASHLPAAGHDRMVAGAHDPRRQASHAACHLARR